MLLKNIVKPDDFECYVRQKKYWDKLHIKNANTSIFDVENPSTLGDKMSWCSRNLKYNNKLFRKTTAKEEVIKILGTDRYIIPTYQICNGIGEINWLGLIGKSFVIKPDNSACCHGVIIQNEPLKKSDINVIKQKCQNDRYLQTTTKIMVEKFIGDKNNKELFQTDYKFWCFHGKPWCIELQNNDKTIHSSCFMDLNFKPMRLHKTYYNEMNTKIKKPKRLKKMIELAEKIAQDMPVVRVDLYNINGEIYFGECQKIYALHCKFKEVADNKKLAYLLDLTKIPQKYLNTQNRMYFAKIDSKTNEAKFILGCDDDTLEITLSQAGFPLYFNTNNKNIKIFNLNNKWFKREYDEYGVIKQSTCKQIYNKNNLAFQDLNLVEAKKQLNMLNSADAKYEYDEEGEVVYYDPNNESVCIKYNANTSSWDKFKCETIKIKQQQI